MDNTDTGERPLSSIEADRLAGPVTDSTLIGIGIAGIIIWYLRQPHVAEVFE